MKIVLFPRRMDAPLVLERRGTVLILNGEPLDLEAAAAADPGALPSPWLAGPVTGDAVQGHVVPLVLPHGADAPVQTRFPAPLLLQEDGPVALPPFGGPAQTKKGEPD